jgi:Fis family transcriptional regulator
MTDRNLMSHGAHASAGLAHSTPPCAIASDTPPQPLREAVETSMRRYFEHLDGGETSDLYAMVMAEVETPLLASVMEYTNGNQTRAAKVLGLNRGTLRKKLKAYGFIDSDAP